jgi:hypothetical protein
MTASQWKGISHILIFRERPLPMLGPTQSLLYYEWVGTMFAPTYCGGNYANYNRGHGKLVAAISSGSS